MLGTGGRGRPRSCLEAPPPHPGRQVGGGCETVFVFDPFIGIQPLRRGCLVVGGVIRSIAQQTCFRCGVVTAAPSAPPNESARVSCLPSWGDKSRFGVGVQRGGAISRGRVFFEQRICFAAPPRGQGVHGAHHPPDRRDRGVRPSLAALGPNLVLTPFFYPWELRYSPIVIYFGVCMFMCVCLESSVTRHFS